MRYRSESAILIRSALKTAFKLLDLVVDETDHSLNRFVASKNQDLITVW